MSKLLNWFLRLFGFRERKPEPAPLPMRPPQVVGINSHTLHDEDFALLAELGITHIRTTGILQDWEEGKWGVDLFEKLEKAKAHGLKILWVLHNKQGPVFFASLDQRSDLMERMSRFAEFVARLPATEAVQLWNEMDVWVEAPFGNTEGLDPYQCGQLYAEQMNRAYLRVKVANPSCIVVTGGTADHEAGRWRGFLKGMVSRRNPTADAVGFHSYGPWHLHKKRIEEARRIIGPSTPIWVTECGHNGTLYFEPDHLQSWQTTIEGNERERFADRLYPYCLQTDPHHSAHGLFNVDGSPRPAFYWLAARNDVKRAA